MKNQKTLIFVTAIVTILSICVYLYGYISHNDIFMQISLAIFGSALVGLIMSVSSYVIIKKQSIESVLYAVDKHMDKLLQVRPINITIPRELLLAYLRGKNLVASDSLYDTLVNNLFIHRETKRGLSVEKLFAEWVKQTHYDNSSEDEIAAEAKERLFIAKRNIAEAIHFYNVLPNYNIESIINQIHDIDYFTSGKRKPVFYILDNLRLWTGIINSLFIPEKYGGSEDLKYYTMLIHLQKAEEKMFSFSEWKPYEYDLKEEDAIFTYRQREIRSIYGEKIERLENMVLGRKALKDDEYSFLRWNEYVIAPIYKE